MRKMIVLAGLLGLATASQATLLTFTANMTGAQEVPGNASAAFGQGFLQIDTVSLAYSGYVRWQGFTTTTPSDSHIHVGPTGVSGSVVYAYGVANTVADGPWTRKNFSGTLINKTPAAPTGYNTLTTPEQQIQNWFLAGNSYFNIHTTGTGGFPAGEIRGQITPVPEPATMAALGLGMLGVLRRRKKA